MADDFETFSSSNSKRSNKSKRCNTSKRRSKYGGSDFISMFSDLFNSINYKVAIFLFILGVLIFSDMFIDTFLAPMSDAVEGDTPTTKGTTIQLLALTFGYIVIDLLVSGEIM